jgi:hypothetical protein
MIAFEDIAFEKISNVAITLAFQMSCNQCIITVATNVSLQLQIMVASA